MSYFAPYNISYGVYIVSTNNGATYNGQVVNTAFQTTAEPATLAICLNKNNLTHDILVERKVFSLSVLEKETPLQFIGLFGFKSGRDVNKFATTEHIIGKTEVPIVTAYTVNYLEAEVLSTLDVGTHRLFVARIVNDVLASDKEVLTYAYYREVKKGFSPKNAPTYQK